MRCEKIVLCGFSGSGKTTLLKELEFLSPFPDWLFRDLDQMIMTSKHTKELSTLIEEHGWEKFRLWERQEFEGFLKEDSCGVLALGGGALTQLILDLYLPSRKVRFCHVVSSFEDCWERLHLEGATARPLVKLGKSELHKIYMEREKIFSQISWKIRNPKGENLETLVKKIWDELK